MAAESGSRAHGENSESLRLARLRPFLVEFAAAALRFPFLCFVAATMRQELPWVPSEEHWPHCPAGNGESHFGLQAYQWKELLRWEARRAMPHETLVWLRFNDSLWEGCFYTDPHCDAGTYQDLDEATKTYRGLARSAAAHLCDRPYPDPQVDFPLSDENADRWLELLLQMPWVEEDGSDFMLLRRLPGNVFDASARAIEYLADSSETRGTHSVAQDSSTHVRAGNTSELSLLDRFPASPDGHVAFLEWVRDEVRLAAGAKTRQFDLGYANDTIESMVRGVKWEEAHARLGRLPDFLDNAVPDLRAVLKCVLTAGTVEAIDERLRPAVAALRDAWENWIRRAAEMPDDSSGLPILNEQDSKSDVLPHELSKKSSAPASPSPLVASARVQLYGRSDRPLVDGTPTATLTAAEYDVVHALLKAGDKGLTKDGLDRESKHGDARKILKRLAKRDAKWEAVIAFAGKPGMGYRIY